MVIDASVAFKFIVEEEGSSAAIAWIGRDDLIAPTLIHAEVGNALWKRVRKQEIVADAGLEEHLADLAAYVRTIDETLFVPRALRMAADLAHPIYDCIYLALAEASDDFLLTADRRFLSAAAGTAYARRIRELV